MNDCYGVLLAIFSSAMIVLLSVSTLSPLPVRKKYELHDLFMKTWWWHDADFCWLDWNVNGVLCDLETAAFHSNNPEISTRKTLLGCRINRITHVRDVLTNQFWNYFAIPVFRMNALGFRFRVLEKSNTEQQSIWLTSFDCSDYLSSHLECALQPSKSEMEPVIH